MADMTKKEFKRALRCGLGRCITELKNTENKEKYRDIVLYGCNHMIAYDPQCEGIRGRYMHTLINCFEDTEPFIEELIKSLKYKHIKDDWEFKYYCNILSLFKMSGNKKADKALSDKYNELLESLHTNKNRYKEDIFETVCLELLETVSDTSEKEKMYLSMAEDIGDLFINSPKFEPNDFYWFGSEAEKYLPSLKKATKKSERITKFLEYHQIHENAFVPKKNDKENITADEIYTRIKEGKEVSIDAGRKLLENEKTEEIERLVQYYIDEKDTFIRLRLLYRLFLTRMPKSDRILFLPPEPVIEDSKSDNEMLRETAFMALERINHTKVREYAFDLLKTQKNRNFAAILLAENYKKEDKELLTELVKSLPITYRNGSWHGAFGAVQDIFERKETQEPPCELLLYMYENSLCSCCREKVLKIMKKINMLKDDILHECLYDSNNNIVQFAREYINEKK